MSLRNLLSRREFIVVAGTAGAGALAACSRAEKPMAVVDNPVEVLARQHAVVYRADGILEEIRGGIDARMDLSPELLGGTVELIRPFVAEHNQLEEKHIYPVFEAAGKMSGLLGVLREQHAAESRLIEIMRELYAGFSSKDLEKRRTMGYAIHLFTRLNRAHSEREDTVLVPLMRRIMTPNSYAELGSTLLRAETEWLGQNGFDETVGKLADFENALGIGDLASFTPGNDDLN